MFRFDEPFAGAGGVAIAASGQARAAHAAPGAVESHLDRFVIVGLTRASCGARFERLRRLQVERLGNRPPLERLQDELPDLQAAVVLATCCRFELHALLRPGASVSDVTLAAGLERLLGLHVSASTSPVMVLRGEAALNHWLWTALGGDSILPGESEILGQLKIAYRQAHTEGALGDAALLHEIYQRGFRLVHRLRLQHFGKGGWSTSLPRLAMERLRGLWGDRPGSPLDPTRRIAIVGAGQVALKIGAWCLRLGLDASQITFYVRNEERARGREGFPQGARTRLVLDLAHDLAHDPPDGLFGAVTHPLHAIDDKRVWARVTKRFPIVDLSVPAMISSAMQERLPEGVAYAKLETLLDEQARRASKLGEKLEAIAAAAREIREELAARLERRAAAREECARDSQREELSA